MVLADLPRTSLPQGGGALGTKTYRGVSPIFLGQMHTHSDIFGLNILSEMVFSGPAKTFDTILVFLGIKFSNADIFEFSRDFHPPPRMSMSQVSSLGAHPELSVIPVSFNTEISRAI